MKTDKPDYDKIREGKIAAMRKFKESYERAVKEGMITYKKI